MCNRARELLVGTKLFRRTGRRRLERAVEEGQLVQDDLLNALSKHEADAHVAITALKVGRNSIEHPIEATGWVAHPISQRMAVATFLSS